MKTDLFRCFLAVTLFAAAGCGGVFKLQEEDDVPAPEPADEVQASAVALAAELQNLDALLAAAAPADLLTSPDMALYPLAAARARALTAALETEVPTEKSRLMAHARQAQLLVGTFNRMADGFESGNTSWVAPLRAASGHSQGALAGLRTLAAPGVEPVPVDSVVDELQGIVVLCSVPSDMGLIAESNGAFSISLTCGTGAPTTPVVGTTDLTGDGQTVYSELTAGEVVRIEAASAEIWTDINTHDPGVAFMQTQSCTARIQRLAPSARAGLVVIDVPQLTSDLQALQAAGAQAEADLQAAQQNASEEWAPGVYQQALAELLALRMQELYIQDVIDAGGTIDDTQALMEALSDLEEGAIDSLQLDLGLDELSQRIQEMADILKKYHDTKKAIIQNLRA